MSKLNSGEVAVTLNGSERVLRPTLNAIQSLSRTYGGLAACRDALVKQDFDAVCNVLFFGMGLKDGERKDLPKAVYKNGLGADLLVPLIKFVGVLGNAGKPVDEDDDGDATGGDTDEGNV